MLAMSPCFQVWMRLELDTCENPQLLNDWNPAEVAAVGNGSLLNGIMETIFHVSHIMICISTHTYHDGNICNIIFHVCICVLYIYMICNISNISYNI